MADYTKLNLREVEDAAKKFGMPKGLESRFAREALELDNQGMTLFTLAPDYRIPFGHRHKRAGRGLRRRQGHRRGSSSTTRSSTSRPGTRCGSPPATRRGLEAGPDGAEVLAVGAPNVGFGDAEQLPDFWPE